MSKKILNLSFLFLILSLISGVFYREFTKYYGYTSYTTLSVVHTHLFMLGTVFLLIIYLVTKILDIKILKAIYVYVMGLLLMSISMLINGIFDVIKGSAYSNTILVGISGISHLMIGVGVIWIIYAIKKKEH